MINYSHHAVKFLQEVNVVSGFLSGWFSITEISYPPKCCLWSIILLLNLINLFIIKRRTNV